MYRWLANQTRHRYESDAQRHGWRCCSGGNAGDRRRKTAHRIDAWIPLADNAIAGNAFRPGDILTAANGTIEVGHTDAEGRLVLLMPVPGAA